MRSSQGKYYKYEVLSDSNNLKYVYKKVKTEQFNLFL